MEEKNSYFKSQKGITLFIFVITVIVMLTLAGMAMSYLIGPDGVLKQVEDSRIPKERQKIYETILSLAEVDNDGIINIDKTLDNIKEKYKEENILWDEVEEDLKLELQVNGKRGEHKFVITTEFIKIMDELPKGLKAGDEIDFDSNYDGITEKWQILHKNNGNIEIISKNVMGKITLGKNDSWVNWNDPEVIKNANIIKENGEVSYEEDGKILYDSTNWTVENLSDIERAIYSYNNLKDSVDEYSKTLINVGKIAGNLKVRNLNVTAGNVITKKCKLEKFGWDDGLVDKNVESLVTKIEDTEIISYDTEALNKEFWKDFPNEKILMADQTIGYSSIGGVVYAMHFATNLLRPDKTASQGFYVSQCKLGEIYKDNSGTEGYDHDFLVIPIIKLKYDG